MPNAYSAFDPYEDRTARDIRNRLSTAFIRAIETGDVRRLESDASVICPPDSERAFCSFADEQLDRYRRAIEMIRAERITDPLHRAVLLWNAGLFFEVHEILETVWNDAQRWRKEALRGLIQAAGVYVHWQRGAGQAAEKLAARAAAHLSTHREDLPELANIEALLEALTDPERPAPALEFIARRVE